jgi:hypothetical protein
VSFIKKNVPFKTENDKIFSLIFKLQIFNIEEMKELFLILKKIDAIAPEVFGTLEMYYYLEGRKYWTLKSINQKVQPSLLFLIKLVIGC